MKKLFALFTLVAAVVAITSCSGGPKIKGTPIEKPHFTIIQPEGWELVANEDAKEGDINAVNRVEIKHKGEKFSHFVNIKEDTEAYAPLDRGEAEYVEIRRVCDRHAGIGEGE